ncbi:MAG: hypothetical protein RIG82_01170 [Phycisphaeraceae bacterium]
MNQTFRCSPLQDLLGQLVRAPAPRRLVQVQRLEGLHDSIESERAYPLDFLVFQITGYRREDDNPTLLLGDAILPDLRLMIDALSRITPVPGSDELVLRPKELATRWRVSLKTLDRYRRLGLRWRWQVAREGQALTVYPLTAVERFEQDHGHRLDLAGTHGRWAEADLAEAVVRALKIRSRARVSANRLARFVAGKMGRPAETLRRRLVRELVETLPPPRQDAASKAKRVKGVGKLDARGRRLMARAHRMGVSPAVLAERFGRSRSSVYRVVQAERVREAKGVLIKRSEGARAFDGEVAVPKAVYGSAVRASAGMVAWPDGLQRVFTRAPLTRVSEQALIGYLHRLLATAAGLRDELDPARPRTGELDRLERMLRQADELRVLVLRAQPGRLMTLASQHLAVSDDAGPLGLLDLLDLGLTDLSEAFDAYDPFHPTAVNPAPFERYLRLRLQRHFAVMEPEAGKARRKSALEEQLAVLVEHCKSLNLMD